MTKAQQEQRRKERREVEKLNDKGVAVSRIAMRTGLEKKHVKKLIRDAKLRVEREG